MCVARVVPVLRVLRVLRVLICAAALSVTAATVVRAQTTPLDTTPSAPTSPSRPDSAAVRALSPDSAVAKKTIDWNAAPPAVRDTTIRHVKPFLVMARSAVVPGWGQVYNRQPLKAVLVVAGEGFLTYKIFKELSLENDAIERGDAADQINHQNRKIDWIWWTAAAHLLQMADAYVDAHFVNFDAEFGPDDDRSSSRGAPRLSLSLNVRF